MGLDYVALTDLGLWRGEKMKLPGLCPEAVIRALQARRSLRTMEVSNG